ncbi:MAG TPA: wax ester/triacylglycerol synthase family O-acyltransferase [Mycobacteriales bacterium]|nr:wax ester/triacylglycerol synthase family O-acyltransferase [Mycobacteriales bacterium]
MTEQLSGMDAAFLALETPEMPMHVVGVLLLTPGEAFSRERVRSVVANRLHRMPPFCRTLVDVPLSLDKPYWHYDTAVDVNAHLVDVTLPAPGDLRALGRFVGDTTTARLDRSRPLWQLYVVDGLADGRWAIVAKVHHSTLYGAAGAEFIAELLDLTPDPGADPAPPATEAQPPPSRVDLLRRTTLAQLRRPLSAGRLVVTGVRNAGGTVGALGGVLRRHGRRGLPPPAPRTALSGSLSPTREAAFGALNLADARAVKDAAGVKLNDVVLAVVAMALRRYLEARDAVPGRAVVAGVPVNAGEGETSGTSMLSTMLVPLPVTDLGGRELLETVHGATVAAKEFTAAVGTSAIAELADVTPPAALSFVTWLTRSLGLTTVPPALANVVVSNVMGPPIPLYLAGATVDAIFPLGPLLPGAGMNITVLSNLDRLDVGVMACPDLVDDVWEVVDAMPACLDDLARATGVATG